MVVAAHLAILVAEDRHLLGGQVPLLDIAVPPALVERLQLLGRFFAQHIVDGEAGDHAALAVHNVLREEAPEQLKTLYEGWWHGYVEKRHLTAEKVPIFCNQDGQVSCYYHGLSFLAAARALETELPESLRQAMSAFSAIAQRPEVRADFMLERGEMLFWHNFLMLHSRQSFTDTPAQKRLLLRLWLHVPGGRPMHPEFLDRARLMDEIHAQGVTALQYAPFVSKGATPEKTLAAAD